MIDIGHPSLARLRDFALEPGGGSDRARVARHLEGCTRCRARVRWMQETVADVRVAPSERPDALGAIHARIAAGDSVLLPSADCPAAGTAAAWGGSIRFRHGAAAAVFVGVVLVAVLLAAPQAGAEKSELRVSPAAPVAGQRLALEYRATVRLAAEERLVVRARIRTPGQGVEPRTVTLGELQRAGTGRFAGTVVLPDSVVYAVLAVEDALGRTVDDHNERWEVLAHGDDALPLFEALRQQMSDALRRNTRLAAETMRAMVTLYPAEPAGWYFLYGQESRSAPSASRDSLRAAYLARLAGLEAAVRAHGEPGPEPLWYLIMHARQLEQPDDRDRLVAELSARFPTDGGALQHAGWAAATRHRGDVPAYLAALDSLWAIAPESAVQPAFDALLTAQRLGDAELILRWVERAEIARPEWAPGHGLQLIDHPATREAGMRRLRAGIARFSGVGGERPLTWSVAEHEASRARTAGMYYAALGRALLAAGRPAAAVDTLDRALRTGWNTPLFRSVGEARLQLGDTAGALASFARLAADPNTSPALADSLRTALGASAAGPKWPDEIARARQELRDELFDRSINRPPLRTRLRLRALDGTGHEVRLDDARLTVVAFWSRYCPPSEADLRRLDAVARHLAGHGVRFIGIPDETDAGAIADYLERQGLTMPTFLDPERDAHNAFDNRSTPSYVVLDEGGRIRFTSHSADDIVRHVAVLGGPWNGVAP